MMLQERDKQVIEFIRKFHAVTTSQIRRVFFKNDFLCQRRLRTLTLNKFMKRCRDNINSDYVYYADKKTAKMQHYITLAGLYVNMLDIPGKMISFEVEKKIDNIIPDGFLQYAFNGNKHSFFIEVHISNNEFNQGKYEAFYRSRKWLEHGLKVFPKIVVITDKKVTLQPSTLRYIMISSDYKNLKGILINT